MKVKNEFVEWLIKEKNPFPTIFSFIERSIWNYKKDIKEYYQQGKKMNSFEILLNDSYSELYTDLLPKYCTGVGLDVNLEENSLIIMDSLSIREAILLKERLKDEGFDINFSFGFSSIPSDTESFKEKIGFKGLIKKHKHLKIKDSSHFLIEGDEKIIWSVFPDSRIENIQAGRTILSDTEKMYDEIEKIVFNILKQHESDRFLITSDHGYTRSAGGYQFKANREDMIKVRDVMGGSRYRETEYDEKIERLVDAGFLIYYNRCAMARARYTWPVSGKYSVYQHGGVSLMECLTPKIEVKR